MNNTDFSKSSSYEREEALFTLAAAKFGAERDAFLDRECGGDAALRRRLELLLEAHERPHTALDVPAAAVPTAKQVPPGAPNDDAVGQTIGRYKLMEKIGEGGWGVVYVAEQSEPVRRRVALKVIKLGMDTKEVVARFESERQALAMMDHPNIAKVLDGGATEAGRPYFAMELVRGVRITDYCDQNHLSMEARLRLFVQVCHAIQHAHQKGVIHRDIKPSNILVMLADDVPVPKVIDFGIAKAIGDRLTDKTVYTQFAQFIGTPAYTSPEQAGQSGLDVDTRSDIYSLGVLLYELLTGRTPLEHKALAQAGLEEIIRCIREDEPPRPSTRLIRLELIEQTTTAQRRATVPPKLIRSLRSDLDWIVMKSIEKNRTRRYETANELAKDIERHLTHEPTQARPPSTVYRVQKFVGRHKVMVAAVAAVAVALVLGTVVSAWQAFRAKRAETRAEAEAGLARHAEKTAREETHTAQVERQRANEAAQAARQNLYAANMNLVQQAWEQNNVRQVRRLLEDTATYPERGFEWYYWQRQSHQELKTLAGHTDMVVCAAFSPDGQQIVTGSFDGTAKVWDVASGSELLTLKGHGAEVMAVAFSPDGRRIVTGCVDRTAKVWDAASGQEQRTLKGHRAGVWSVAFSPDSLRILTGSMDGTAMVWDAASGHELLTFEGHSSTVWSVGFSPDGQRIVSSDYGTVKVWEAASGRELSTSELLGAGIQLEGVSPGGQRIVIWDGDHLKVWEAASGKELFTLDGHSAQSAAWFSLDGRRIVTTSNDQTAKVWDAASGHELLTLKGHGAPIWYVAFSPDGQRIVTTSKDQTAKVWDAASHRGPIRLEGHSAGIRSVAFSPDGRRVVTGSNDRTAKVWEATGGHGLFALSGHSDRIFSGAFSADGQRIVTGSADQTARVWDASIGKELFALRGHSAEVWSVAFAPDGQHVVTGSADGTAKVWAAAKGSQLLTLSGHAAGIRSVAFSPDGQRIVTGSLDRTAKVWAAAGGKQLLTLNGHGNQINAAAFSPDGRRILTGSEDQTAKVWDAASGTNLLTLDGHSAGIWAVAFSPDGRRILTGSQDGTTKVWEAASGTKLLTLEGSAAGIWSVAFSPDGQRIVTGSEDQTAKVWEAAIPQQVAAWQREEKADTEQLAVRRREQARTTAQERALRVGDPGAIKQWLLLAPIGFERGTGLEALDLEQVPQEEADLRPQAGERVKVFEGERVWRSIQLEDYLIDFNALLGEQTEWSMAYAVCYIQSDTAQAGLLMKVGSDDAAKVYLNGKQIYEWRGNRVWMPDQDEVRGVELKPGLNVLVFKVVNLVRYWKGSIRFTDAAGQPLKGIRVTLDPEGKG